MSGDKKGEPQDRLNTLFVWVLLGMVALTPLPLGSNRPLPIAFIIIVSALLALAATAQILLKDGKRLRRLRIPMVPAALFITALVFIAIQGLVPMPTGLAHPLWATAAEALNRPDLTAYLSIDPAATTERLPLLAAYGLLFLVTHLTARRFNRLQLLTNALLIIGGVWLGLAFADFIIYGENRLLGDPSAYPGVPTGPFVNRNSFATYAGMMGTAGLVMVVWTLMASAGTTVKSRSAIADTLTDKSLPLLFGLVLFAGGLTLVLLTESRAGFTATMAATLCVLLLVPASAGGKKNSKQNGRRLTILAIALALAAGWVFTVYQLSGEGVEARFDVLDDDMRWGFYTHILTMIDARPLLGTGYDTFEAAYAMTRGVSELGQPSRVDHAHSTYLELAAEIGVVATLALILAPLLIALRLISVARKGGRAAIPAAIAVVWTVLLGLHTAVDFSAEMPAIAVVYAIALGLGSGAARVLENRT